MMQRDGDVMTHVVPDVKRKTLHPIINANVETGSTISTDELRSYNGLNNSGYVHNTVNHGIGQYAHGDTHVNSMEGYWAHLKKSIRSTHIHVSEKHLAKYAKEFEYRFNSRKNPEQMFPELISNFQDEK
jgi:transposase